MDRVLAWLSQCIKANERDKGAKATHRSFAFGDAKVPTDNFLVSTAAVALRFARPIADGAEKLVDARLKDLVPLRHNWRHDWAADDTLARRPAVSNENGRASARPSAPPSFVSETFYLAARAFTHALIPAVRRYEEAMQILHQRAIGGVSSAENATSQRLRRRLSRTTSTTTHTTIALRRRCWIPSSPETRAGSDLLTAHWLIQMARVPDEERRKECFGLIPEDCVKSLAEDRVHFEARQSGVPAQWLNLTTSCRCRRLFDAHANSCPSRRWRAIRRSTRHSLRCFRRCSSAKGVTRAPRGPEFWE